MLIIIARFNIYTQGLTTSPGQIRPVTNLKKKNSLIYDNLDSNLSLLWSPTCLLALCLADPANKVHSLDVAISLAELATCLAVLIGGLGFP